MQKILNSSQRINAMIQRVLLLLSIMLSIAHGQQTLNIGSTTFNPPFNSLADVKNHFYGFDVDIMGEICRRIKQRCQFKPAIFNNLFTQISSKKIDLAIASIIITASRKQKFLFSLPYLESNAQFLTQKTSAINQPKDILNQRVGVRRGTVFKELALSLYRNKITVKEFPEINDIIDALNMNQVDVVLMPAESARYWFSNNSMIYKLVGAQIPIGDGYGIMANQNEGELITAINQALISMEADGTYLKIFRQYFNDSGIKNTN